MSLKLEWRNMPVIALRGLVPFPKMIMNFDVGRKASLDSLISACSGDRIVFLVTQRNMADVCSSASDLASVGCVARINQTLKMPDGTVKVVAECLYRAKTKRDFSFTPGEAIYADVARCSSSGRKSDPIYRETLLRRLKQEFVIYADMLPKLAPDIPATVADADVGGLGEISDYIAFNIMSPYTEKIYVIEETNEQLRAELVIAMLKKEQSVIKIDHELSEKVKEQIDDNNREYYLREQMKAINTELYGDESVDDEFNFYLEKIHSLNADESVKEKLVKEINKLIKLPQGSHDGGVIRGYLDMCIELPWNSYTPNSQIDIKRAAAILERDFYGMKKVKDRILEMLSVYVLAPEIRGQIICLVGPPGVGKTSIGKTIAECMDRRFARVSLGGVHDESEIRGHRRTYVAAMPGKIINAIKSAGCGNPVILLDEIDKIGSSYKGDPASALLEVLDPEQNVGFIDHYVDIPYDLSKVLFITTANSVDTIPAPLLDRMEIIELSSYTREEKFNIAKKHLISAEIKRHGLSHSNFRMTDKAIYGLIDFYTREAGVRRLQREIAAVCRKSAKMITEGTADKIVADQKCIEGMLGRRRYLPEMILHRDEIGVVNGLAWTSVGGEIMQLEVAVCAGSGKLELTGSLGEVMQESAKAAVTYVRCHAAEFNICEDFYSKYDIHIHATEAAVPKDGPSAGVSITTALVSALTGDPIRRDVAMTGEVTIRGRVLQIGGLKEKSMAAYRGGVKTIFIPKDNEADLAELDSAVLENVRFVPVTSVDEIISAAIIHSHSQKQLVAAVPDSAKAAVISQ